MEEMKMCASQMQRPVKTEWSSRCVLFTYFQGDISSVVDEHFSRALSNVKNPKELSPLSRSGDVVLRNGIGMLPNQWCFSSQWTKPQPQISFANGDTNCGMNGFGPMAMDQYPRPPIGSPFVQPGVLWHFSPRASLISPGPQYLHAFSTGHLVPEAQHGRKYESLLNFLHQERCIAHPQQSAMWVNCNSAQAARKRASPCSLSSSSARSKKYFLPDRGPANGRFVNSRLASARLGSGKSQYPERRKDLLLNFG